MIHYIDPLTRFGSRLMELEKPYRYTGGEYGTYRKKGILNTAIIFPDLYELGMSNQAFRIIYNGLNRIDDISCDRAFAPAPDFEKLLKEEELPLYGLDTGIALCDTDLLLFTLGYELGITGLLSVLGSSCIALRCSDRSEKDPIVIMGGPCVSNPLPYSLFVDAFWIGEAEAGFFDLAQEVLKLKKSAAARIDIFNMIKEHPHIWTPGKTGVRRAIDPCFGKSAGNPVVFPVSSTKTVQNNGVVEIMRGCPNGCRFCHAGMWYRPMRQKRADIVLDEVEKVITMGGYREISLSSLSSGDYMHIDKLIDSLNKRYNDRHISFQLPSLKVSGFSLPLLAKISTVRKSGLTFAVETPEEMDQLAINKQVSINEIISIINESKKYGWRSIKFYFMLGLPLSKPGFPLGKPELPNTQEELLIVDFIKEAGKETGIKFHINIGIFVPKPHTPYQWAAQLDEDTAWEKLYFIKDKLKQKGHKVSIHNPFISLLEGIFTRGTETAGLLAEIAYKNGCRLDAWSEYIKLDVWKKILDENNSEIQFVTKKKNKSDILPWAIIDSRVGESYLKRQETYSLERKITSPCIINCTERCGICSNDTEIVYNSIHDEVSLTNKDISLAKNDNITLRMLLLFSKQDSAVFIPHLGVLESFSAAIVRSEIKARFTYGYNPLLKIDFASPAPLGLCCNGEIAYIDIIEPIENDQFVKKINTFLPLGLNVIKSELFIIPFGGKKHSPASLLWGYNYYGSIIPVKDEKKHRQELQGQKNIYGIVRDGVLAKNPDTGEPEDYFKVYQRLYPAH